MKKSPRFRKFFVQVTLVEKGHGGNISQPRPLALASKTISLMPFSHLGNLDKNFLNMWTIFPNTSPEQL